MIHPVLSCQVALGSFELGQGRSSSLCCWFPSACPGPKSSPAWAAHPELPQPGALGLVGHTLAGTPFPDCSHSWLEGSLSEMC